jgi:predicted ATPase
MMGMDSESLAHSDRSLELAARVDRPLTNAMIKFMRAILHLSRAEVREFTDWVEQARAYSVERNIRYWRMLSSAYSNWRRAIAGDHEAGIARLEASIESFVESGARLGLVHLYVLLADLQLDAGAPSAARDAIARAEDQMVRSGERLTEVELRRCKARVWLKGGQPDPAAAIAELERAVEVGEGQGALLPQLRALGQLVTVRRRAGEDDSAAVQRLAAVCERFGGESQLADVRRGRAILEADPVSS